MDELPLLMALRVQGLASPQRAAIAAGCTDEAAKTGLVSLVERDLCAERGTRGFTLTPKGVEHLSKLLAGEGLHGSEALTECYERFLGLNKRVLRISSDWQLRRDGGVETPND